MKKQEGVTLIALAVTIIVMLILAGVSISALTGNSGISKNAENARLQNELGSIVEKINLAISESFMDDVNVDKMKVLIDKGYIIENKNENYDYVDVQKLFDDYYVIGRLEHDRYGRPTNRKIVQLGYSIGVNASDNSEAMAIKIHHSKNRTHIVLRRGE